jgi:hypothetical protein
MSIGVTAPPYRAGSFRRLGAAGNNSSNHQPSNHRIDDGKNERKFMYPRFFLLSFICLLSLCTAALAQTGKPPEPPAKEAKPADNSAKEKAAQAAAESWLALVDAGKYSDSWEQAAQAFKDQVTKDDWNSAVQQARQPLAKLKTRKLKHAQYTTQLPGVPAGEYVMLQYESGFEAKADAAEVVALVLEKSGQWRVGGYFIQ